MNIKRRFVFLLFLVLFLPCVLADQPDLGSMIQKAETLIKQGSYAAGISILETVLTKDSQNANALSSLLSAYDQYSQKLIAENNFSAAQTYLHKMDDLTKRIEASPISVANQDSKVQPRIQREMAEAKAFMLHSPGAGAEIISLNAGREHYNEAVKYFNKRQYDIAEDLLKQSIQLDQSNPYAYELLGEIANLTQRLTEAEQYYKQAFLISSDPDIRAKYEKIIREKSIDRNQQEYQDEHFTIRYRRNESIEGSEIREYLREAYRTISQAFGHYPNYKISVILYDREEYQKLMGSVPHWSGALYDGKIRLPVYSGSSNIQSVYDDRELRKLIHHELTHAFVLDLSQTKCPIWLNEGLAQYFENQIKPIDLSLLKNAVKTNSLFGTDELMFQDISKVTSHERALVYYLESFSLVSHVLTQRKMYQMKQSLMELGKGTDFNSAFEKSFGRTFKDMASDWKKELTG